MKPVIVESEHVGASPTVEDQASSGMYVGGLNGIESSHSLHGGAFFSLAGGFFLARSSKYFIRISCGCFSMSAAKRSSASFSLTAESTLMEDASSEESIAAKLIGANTFHHTMKNSIRIKHQRLLLSKLIMMDTISRIFRLSVMVELGESIVRDKCISQEELAQIDRHRQKSIFFLHIASIRTTRTIRCINNYLYKKINNYLHSSILLCIHLCIHA